MPHLGLFHLKCLGESSFRIRGAVDCEEWPDPRAGRPCCRRPHRCRLPAEYESLAELLSKIIEKFGAERFPSPPRLDDAAWVAYRLAEVLPLELEFKQQLLESTRSVRATRAAEGISANQIGCRLSTAR